MNRAREIQKKIYDLADGYNWDSFKNSLILFFSQLAAPALAVLMIWSLVQYDRILMKSVVPESFEGDSLRVHVRAPKYIGRGEQGVLSISVENFNERNIEYISIYVSDNNGDHIWFPEGNSIEFNDLKQNGHKTGEIVYFVDASVPDDVRSFNLTIDVDYRYIEAGQTDVETDALPSTKNKCSDCLELQVDKFKTELISLGNAFEMGSQGLSGIEVFMGILAALFASVVTLKGNIFEIFGGKKS